MKNLQLINDRYYVIHRVMPLHIFKSKDGVIKTEWMKAWKDHIIGVDHVMKTDTHVIFAETVQDAEIIEETVEAAI